jgi:hypothetical protein
VAAFNLARQLEDLRQRLQTVVTMPAERDEEYATLVYIRLTIMEQLKPFVFSGFDIKI